jgi:hypothetical protein
MRLPAGHFRHEDVEQGPRRARAPRRLCLDGCARPLQHRVARTLTVAEITVKTHLAHILGKLGLRDRVHAVVYGYEHGLITPGATTEPA